ncbi:hypothetical protein TWF506_009562 [Arthrobotrys conoides]|uniref:F-box domain-containing protein n=1 Tax=Arthrobotrys conoides TaxID=74498 RepID=A0AAN8N2G1_9PEZI
MINSMPRLNISLKEMLSRQASPPSQPIDGPFPFLSLPRELRDEIYSYFLLFDPPKELFTIPVPLPDWPFLDISLFYLNKQIHDEATEFFYSRNIFPIYITIRSEGPPRWLRDRDPQDRDNVGYKVETEFVSLWERFFHCAFLPYGFHEFFEVRAYRVANDASEVDYIYGKYEINSPPPSIPALRYCRHFRNIQINIIDLRRPSIIRVPLVPSEPVRRILQTTYQPLTHHLKHILEAPGEHLKININIMSVEHMLHTGRVTSNQHLYWKKYAKVRGGPATNRHSDAYYFPLYEDLLRMAWPFTTGPWRSKVRTSIDEVFEHKVQPILRSCDDNAALNTYIMEFKPYFLATGCTWVLVGGGRRFLGKFHISGEGGAGQDIDENEYILEDTESDYPNV